MEKIEKLLLPRFKVVADYPNSPYVVGEVKDNLGPNLAKHFSQWPHLFQPLPWWSDRNVEDMPEYVWYNPSGFTKRELIVLKVAQWHKEKTGEPWAEVEGDAIGYAVSYMPKPASLEEYTLYINSK